jgi:hypothetical protein
MISPTLHATIKSIVSKNATKKHILAGRGATGGGLAGPARFGTGGGLAAGGPRKVPPEV